MAAAAVSPAVDLRSQATFPIRLGASISKSSSNTAQLTSIRYNHKPAAKQLENARASVEQVDQPEKSRLILDCDAGQFAYSGKQCEDEQSYVLVIRGQGKEKEMVLERMNNSLGYNLVSTPSTSDAAKLARQYPHLPDDEGEEDDLFGDSDDAEPPDDSNPFDYRHFLHVDTEKLDNSAASQDTLRSTTDTPIMQPRVTAKSAAEKPAKRAEPKPQPQKKRKTPATAKANSKRVKAGEEPTPPSTESTKPKTKPEVPRINMDRKASLRRPSLDDGELILENETPISEKPPRDGGAMALALRRSGPISLISAASTPGSHVASPTPQRPEGMEEKYVFEFDDDPEPLMQDDDQGEGDADEEDAGGYADADDDDDDVDDLELPSPAQAHRPNEHSDPVEEAGDDDDDLDKQLALAMMEEDDGGNQESEESEEE